MSMAGLTALQGFRDKGKVTAGQHVLVNGAGGGVGTMAVQIAKAFGAEVTGVCSTGNVDMVRSIGADHVVDYTNEDFVDGGQRYDVMIDNVGNRSLPDCVRTLQPKGVYVIVGAPDKGVVLGPAAGIFGALARSPFVSQKVAVFVAKHERQDLLVLADLVTSGKLVPGHRSDIPARRRGRRAPSRRQGPRERQDGHHDVRRPRPAVHRPHQ